MKVNIIYSLMNDTIAKQLKSQKIAFDKEKVKALQEHAFHALSLCFHEIITEKQKDSIIQKVHERLEKHLTEISMEFNFNSK